MPCGGSEYDWKHHQEVYRRKCDKLAKRYPHLSREEVKRVVDRKMRY